MINKQKTRALVEIVAEEERQSPQPVEGISSAFLHGYLDSMTEKILQDTSELKNSLGKTGPILCLDTNEGYYQVPYRYC